MKIQFVYCIIFLRLHSLWRAEVKSSEINLETLQMEAMKGVPFSTVERYSLPICHTKYLYHVHARLLSFLSQCGRAHQLKSGLWSHPEWDPITRAANY